MTLTVQPMGPRERSVDPSDLHDRERMLREFARRAIPEATRHQIGRNPDDLPGFHLIATHQPGSPHQALQRRLRLAGRIPRPGEPLWSQLDRGVLAITGGASALFDNGRDLYLKGSIASLSDTIKAALVTNGYSSNQATDQFYTTISSFVVGTDQTLANKSASGAGVFNADPAVWSGGAAPPSSATPIASIEIYKSTGVAGTSPLLVDIQAATNLPLTPNGGSVSLTWSTGANKIFKL